MLWLAAALALGGAALALTIVAGAASGLVLVQGPDLSFPSG
jgi:hypothetical protein